jgi:hypothetical protein
MKEEKPTKQLKMIYEAEEANEADSLTVDDQIMKNSKSNIRFGRRQKPMKARVSLQEETIEEVCDL